MNHWINRELTQFNALEVDILNFLFEKYKYKKSRILKKRKKRKAKK